jgi:outer membrane immunogenic protein
MLSTAAFDAIALAAPASAADMAARPYTKASAYEAVPIYN